MNSRATRLNPIQFIVGFLLGAILFGVIGGFAATQVQTLYPNADGTYSQWNGNGGSCSSYTCVDESSSDGDTTYIFDDSGVIQTETYNLSNLDATSLLSIDNITVIITIKCYPNGGNCTTDTDGFVIYTYSTIYLEQATTVTSETYIERSNTWATNPNTGLAWTVSEVNSLEVGVRDSDAASLQQFRVTQIRVEVTYQSIIVGSLNNPYNYTQNGLSETVTGMNFGAPGKVELCSDTSCTISPDQAIISWSDTSISITTVITGLSDGAIYLRVTENGGAYNQIPLTLDTQVPTISGTSTKDEGDNYGILTSMADPPVSPSGWATGCKLNGCMEFDGTNDYIEVKESGNLDFSNGSSISIDLWVYLDNVTANRSLVCKRSTGTDPHFCIVILTTDTDDIRFLYRNSADTASHAYDTSCNCFTTGAWQHLILTYTYGTGSSMIIYRNGSSITGSWTTGTGNDAPLQNDVPLSIGWSNETTDKWLDGKVDEMAIWNILLTGATTPTIAQRYNSGNGKELVGNESNLIAVWHFNEGKGILANDTKKTTLEGATVYKHDPVYIDLGATNGVNTNVLESCLHARWFDAITIKDATGPDDVTSDTMFYDMGNGRIKLQPPTTGWPTADNPLKINISTSLSDCGNNVLASSFAMTTGFTASVLLQESAVLISATASTTPLRSTMQSKATYAGGRYWVFADNGTNIEYWSSENRSDWIKGNSTLGTIGDGRDFDVAISENWAMLFFVCYNAICEKYRWDTNTPSMLLYSSSPDNTCGTATTPIRTSVAWANGNLHIVYLDGGNAYWCKSNTSFNINFSSDRTLLQDEVNSISAIQIEREGTDFDMISCWEYSNTGNEVTIRCKYYDDSVGTWSSVETPVSTSELQSWKLVVTQTYVNLIYKKDADNKIHMIKRTKGPSGSWGAESGAIVTSSASCCSLTAMATYKNGDGMVLFHVKPTTYDVNYIIYDGTSWGSESTLVNVSNAIQYNVTGPDIEPEYPFIVFYNADGILIDWLEHRELGGSHNPGGDGGIISIYGTNIFEPIFFRFAATANQETCIGGYLSRSRKPSIMCMNNIDYSIQGTYTLNDSSLNYDSHNNVNMIIENNNYLYSVYGGRYITTYGGDDTMPLQYRKSILPISDSNFKPYMQAPAIDTGYAPTYCTRGYKFLVVDSNNIIHVICQSLTQIFIGNNEGGNFSTPTSLVNVSCDSTVANHMTYVFDVTVGLDNSINFLWSYLDYGSTQGLNLYYGRCEYNSGLYTCEKADQSTTITIPMKPTATGCSDNAAEMIWSGYVDGIYSSGDLELSYGNYPYFVFHEEAISQTYTDDLIFVFYDNGNAESGNCRVNWQCTEREVSVEGFSRLSYKKGTAVLDVLYAKGGDIKRQRGIISGAFPNNVSVSFLSPDTIVDDANYSISLRNAADGGSGRDFLVNYIISRPTWSEAYFRFIELSNFPVLYRILGD